MTMTTDLNSLLTAARLDDTTERLMLADELAIAGRDTEAELLRDADVRVTTRGGKLVRLWTALEWANEHDHVVLRYASQGAPAGLDVALLNETELPFDLDEVEGVYDEGDKCFLATNLGIRDGGWRFRDGNRNSIYAMWLREDVGVWQEQHDDYYGVGEEDEESHEEDEDDLND